MPASTLHNTTLAKPVAPEDLRRGDYVAVLTEAIEAPSFLWGCDSPSLAPDEPVVIRYRPQQPGVPLKVRDLCLPFVLVRLPCGHTRTLDIRGCQLARLARGFAKRVRKGLQQGSKKSRRGCCEDNFLL